MTTEPIKLSYQESEALHLIRKTIQRRPEVAALLLDGMTKEAAMAVMLKIRDELAQMLEINRAFSEVAGKLAQLEKKDETPPAGQADTTRFVLVRRFTAQTQAMEISSEDADQ